MDTSRAPQPPTMSWEMLEKSLAHPNVLIREKALETAGRLGDARAVVALAAAARDENPRLRTAAAQAFVHALARKSADIDAAVAGLIATPGDDELRRFLISQSTASGSPALLRVLIESLVDTAPSVRHAAEEALTSQKTWLFSSAAGEAGPVIEAATRSANAEVAAAARAWQEKLQRAQVRRTMLDTGVATILTLHAGLKCGSAAVRAGAAWALAQSNDPRVVPALADALRDPDEAVRHAAALSLAQLQWGAATDEEHAAQLVALGRWPDAVALGAPAVDALLRAAQHAGAATQSRAIAALAETKSVRAILPLQELLKSPHAAVRRAAALALKELEWVPATDAQAVAHAIELEDWPGAAALGTPSVAPLMGVLKGSLTQPERTRAVADALARLTAPDAAPSLVTFCRDGEVAAAAARALEALLKNPAGKISDDALRDIAALNNVVQFQFTADAQYQKPVRTGLEFVETGPLRALAQAELSRRAATSTTEAA